MPDILIRGMKMPDSCEFCRFHGYGGYEFERVVCSLTGRSKEKPIFSRFDDCPLIGIPPHGDLISRDDAIIDVNERGYDFWNCDADIDSAVLFLNEQPVIVPASK